MPEEFYEIFVSFVSDAWWTKSPINHKSWCVKKLDSYTPTPPLFLPLPPTIIFLPPERKIFSLFWNQIFNKDRLKKLRLFLLFFWFFFLKLVKRERKKEICASMATNESRNRKNFIRGVASEFFENFFKPIWKPVSTEFCTFFSVISDVWKAKCRKTNRKTGALKLKAQKKKEKRKKKKSKQIEKKFWIQSIDVCFRFCAPRFA